MVPVQLTVIQDSDSFDESSFSFGFWNFNELNFMTFLYEIKQ